MPSAYIAYDVENVLGCKEVRVELDGYLVAAFYGAYGARLFADFIGAAARRGDSVRGKDGAVLAGDVGELVP